MSPGPISPDYRPAVRATLLWAGLNSAAVAVLAVPFLGSAIGQIRAGLAIGRLLVVLVAAALVALLLYGVARCSILSAFAVLRRPDYPDRHWKTVRGSLRNTLWFEGVALVLASAASGFAIFGRGPVAESILPVAAVVDALAVLSLIPAVFGMDDMIRRATVIPYFPSKVGAIETFGEGNYLARHVAALDEVAGPLGLRALSSFGWNDDMAGEVLEWHEAEDGIATAEGLLSWLGADPPAWDDLGGVVADLKRLAAALRRAEAQGIPFSLLLRHCSATNGQEWEVRKGTCF